jgi:hypothetical protein
VSRIPGSPPLFLTRGKIDRVNHPPVVGHAVDDGEDGLASRIPGLASRAKRSPSISWGGRFLFMPIRQVQHARRPDLSKEQFFDPFAVWADRYRGRQLAQAALAPVKRAAWREDQALFDQRAALPPSEHAALQP